MISTKALPGLLAGVFVGAAAIIAPLPAAAIQIERNVAVPMRDGVVLRADVYSPDEPGPHPVLVLRTPYGKDGNGAEPYVKAGYIVCCWIMFIVPKINVLSRSLQHPRVDPASRIVSFH